MQQQYVYIYSAGTTRGLEIFELHVPVVQGVGANSATLAHMAEQEPRAELQPTMAAGAAAAAIVPNVQPAAT